MDADITSVDDVVSARHPSRANNHLGTDSENRVSVAGRRDRELVKDSQ
jgi:hypothetical protein